MAFFISVHSVFTYKADRRAAGFGNVEALCSRDPNDTPPFTKCTRQHNDLKENTILGMRIPRITLPNTTGIFVEGCSVVLI